MLAGVVANEADLQVRLMVSQSLGTTVRPRRYKSALCLPVLYPRRGIKRLLNLWVSWKLLRYQIMRCNARGHKIVLFVRNDPVCLLVCSILRSKIFRLVFQSSFPHEEYSGNFIKRYFAKKIYRAAGFGIDAVTGVSPAGTERIRRLLRRRLPGCHIPLLADLPFKSRTDQTFNSLAVPPTFVYIGSHATERELDTVFSGIHLAIQHGVKAKFLFVGASVEEKISLLQDLRVKELIDWKVLHIEGFVTRDKIPDILAASDVGLSLIAIKPVYIESSPTKLAEYMGAGLAVIATSGIPLQEMFIEKSNGGILVEWNAESIAGGIERLVSTRGLIARLSNNAKHYADQELKYSKYLCEFRRLLLEND